MSTNKRELDTDSQLYSYDEALFTKALAQIQTW